MTVKLTGCEDTEFTCDDGQCIDINKRCDQIIHCRDESDEQNCNLLFLKEGYNLEIPPFSTTGEDDFGETGFIPAMVNISTVFMTGTPEIGCTLILMLTFEVIEINEQDHIIELKFSISLTWYEARASYYNLKANPALNVLNGDEIQQIWIPYMIFKVINIIH